MGMVTAQTKFILTESGITVQFPGMELVKRQLKEEHHPRATALMGYLFILT
jgi:hypothetical protein